MATNSRCPSLTHPPHSSPMVGNQLKCAIVMPITLAPRTGCYAGSPDRQDDWERENATNPDGSLDRGGRSQTNLPNGTGDAGATRSADATV
jgi:hypothetical protein